MNSKKVILIAAMMTLLTSNVYAAENEAQPVQTVATSQAAIAPEPQKQKRSWISDLFDVGFLAEVFRPTRESLTRQDGTLDQSNTTKYIVSRWIGKQVDSPEAKAEGQVVQTVNGQTTVVSNTTGVQSTTAAMQNRGIQSVIPIDPKTGEKTDYTRNKFRVQVVGDPPYPLAPSPVKAKLVLTYASSDMVSFEAIRIDGKNVNFGDWVVLAERTQAGSVDKQHQFYVQGRDKVGNTLYVQGFINFQVDQFNSFATEPTQEKANSETYTGCQIGNDCIQGIADKENQDKMLINAQTGNDQSGPAACGTVTKIENKNGKMYTTVSDPNGVSIVVEVNPKTPGMKEKGSLCFAGIGAKDKDGNFYVKAHTASPKSLSEKQQKQFFDTKVEASKDEYEKRVAAMLANAGSPGGGAVFGGGVVNATQKAMEEAQEKVKAAQQKAKNIWASKGIDSETHEAIVYNKDEISDETPGVKTIKNLLKTGAMAIGTFFGGLALMGLATAGVIAITLTLPEIIVAAIIAGVIGFITGAFTGDIDLTHFPVMWANFSNFLKYNLSINGSEIFKSAVVGAVTFGVFTWVGKLVGSAVSSVWSKFFPSSKVGKASEGFSELLSPTMTKESISKPIRDKTDIAIEALQGRINPIAKRGNGTINITPKEFQSLNQGSKKYMEQNADDIARARAFIRSEAKVIKNKKPTDENGLINPNSYKLKDIRTKNGEDTKQLVEQQRAKLQESIQTVRTADAVRDTLNTTDDLLHVAGKQGVNFFEKSVHQLGEKGMYTGVAYGETLVDNYFNQPFSASPENPENEDNEKHGKESR